MSLDSRQLKEIVSESMDIAISAGALLLEGLNRPKQITHKGEVDLVTEYDHRAEELIKERLTRRFPDFGILAEESGQSQHLDAKARWIIDPLDGTTNFSHGHPIFAVSMGLESEGELVAGIIVMPALGWNMTASRGSGAFCNGEPIAVSSRRELDKSLMATGFPYDRRTVCDDNTREWVAFMKRSQGMRRCGSAASDMAMVARGIYDGFWEPRLHPWDLAAGIVLVKEAGGRVSDYQGGLVDLDECTIVASNGAIHSQMIEVIKAARQDL